MLHHLEPADYARAQSVVDALDHALLVRAVIEGTAPGWIAIDHPTAPQAVFASGPGAHYLLGDAGNAAFNAAVRVLILEQIMPHAREAGWDVVNLHYYPNTWEDVLDPLWGDAPVVKNHQRYYRFRGQQGRVEIQPEPGREMRRVDADLFAESGLENVEQIKDFAQGTWTCLQAYLDHGLGMCLIQDGEIISWCTTDCVIGQRCEVGIRTLAPYRRQGLGTLVALATVDACLARGLTEIGWHCWSQNLASAATAERAGFREVLHHHAVHVWLNPVDGLLVNANLALMRSEYRAAAELYERAFALREAQGGDTRCLMGTHTPEATYLSYCAYAWARAGDAAAAGRTLERVLETGTFRQAGY